MATPGGPGAIPSGTGLVTLLARRPRSRAAGACLERRQRHAVPDDCLSPTNSQQFHTVPSLQTLAGIAAERWWSRPLFIHGARMTRTVHPYPLPSSRPRPLAALRSPNARASSCLPPSHDALCTSTPRTPAAAGGMPGARYLRALQGAQTKVHAHMWRELPAQKPTHKSDGATIHRAPERGAVAAQWLRKALRARG